MKVVISTEFYAPMINGVAVFANNLAKGLAERGHEVLVLAPSISGDYSARKTEGVRVARLSSIKMPFYPDQINKVNKNQKVMGMYKNGLHVSVVPYREIKKLLDKFHPDVIHNQTPGPIGLAVHRYAKRRGVPIVATSHAYPDNLTSQLKALKLIKKPTDAVIRAYFAGFLKRADHATMPTQIAIDELASGGGIDTPVEALSNGIDLSQFRAAEAPERIYEKYKISRERPVVGYVGRVDPEKSMEVLLQAFAKTLTAVPEAMLVIVGDGTDRVRMEKLAVELGISDSVQFLGRIIGDDLPEMYRTFDIFAITSETETQSIVLMEALASGLPAVAVKAGAVGELVINGRNGFLCQPRDVAEVVAGMTALLLDKALRKKYGKESLRIIAKHDIKYTLDRIEEIYAEVVAKKSATAVASSLGRS